MKQGIENKLWRLPLLLIGLLVLCGILACSGENTQKVGGSPLTQQFFRQLNRSCQEQLTEFKKSITNLAQETPTTQDSIWDHMPSVIAGEKADGSDSIECILFSELEWATKFDHQSPGMVEYYENRMKGDTLVATIIKGEEAKSELKEQKLLYNEDKSQLLYLSSLISKSNWLYAFDVRIQVFFHNDGLYHKHYLTAKNEVSFIGSGFHAMVSGQAKYLVSHE